MKSMWIEYHIFYWTCDPKTVHTWSSKEEIILQAYMSGRQVSHLLTASFTTLFATCKTMMYSTWNSSANTKNINTIRCEGVCRGPISHKTVSSLNRSHQFSLARSKDAFQIQQDSQPCSHSSFVVYVTLYNWISPKILLLYSSWILTLDEPWYLNR